MTAGKRVMHKAGFLLFFVVLNHLLYSQDPFFSQFYNAPLQLNPAFTGHNSKPFVAVNYRNQWPQWGPRAYSTYAASVDQFLENLNSGFGLQLLYDNEGDGILSNYKVGVSYAYRLRFNKNLQAKLGFEVGAFMSRLDWNRLIFYDQINQNTYQSGGGSLLPSGESRPTDLNNVFFDLSMGALVYNNNFYAGFSLKHVSSTKSGLINNPLNIPVTLPLRFSVHGGYTYFLKNKSKDEYGTFIAPNFVFVSQSEFVQVNVGAIVNHDKFFGGAWLRYTFSNIDAVILSFGTRINKYKLSYSFDLTISEALLINTGGSHEIGVIVNFGYNSSDVNINDCFRLFN